MSRSDGVVLPEGVSRSDGVVFLKGEVSRSDGVVLPEGGTDDRGWGGCPEEISHPSSDSLS